MRVTKIIRLSEWWEYKLAPLFALGYATAQYAGMSFTDLLPNLAMVILSAGAGAIYVSVLNDFTDIKEDLACGKANLQSKLSLWQRSLLLLASVLPGVLFLFFFYNDPLTQAFYFLSGLSFSLYSMPPVRLKKRGRWGLAADASGAHLFPTLTVVAAVLYFAGQKTDALWMTAAGVWAFFYGLRGIMWHQFSDRINDQQAGMRTYAAAREIPGFWFVAKGILVVEGTALLVLLYLLNLPLVWVAFALYILAVAAARSFLGLRVIAVLPVPGRNYIVLTSFYQFVLPLALLVGAALQQPQVWWLVALHLVLFPKNLLAGYGNGMRLLGRVKATS